MSAVLPAGEGDTSWDGPLLSHSVLHGAGPPLPEAGPPLPEAGPPLLSHSVLHGAPTPADEPPAVRAGEMDAAEDDSML